MLTSRDQAKAIAQTSLGMASASEEYNLVILDEYTIEKKYAFVFFYDSSKYIESGDINDMLAGNAPIFVERKSGEIFDTGTAYPIDYYLSNYEKYGSTYPP